MKFALALVSLVFSPVFGCSGIQPSKSSAKLQAAAPRVSAFFAGNCTVCHGANGDEGFAPQLSLVEYHDYVHSVRSGHPDKGVPPFTADEYPFSVLNADYSAVTGKPAR